MPTIGFLHTAAVHEATFAALVAELAPGTEVVTVVDDVLLDRARTLGSDHLEVVGAIADRLAQLYEADAVVCTCSTIGGTAEHVGAEAGMRVVRVDRPMAERAVVSGERIAVLAAVESTLEPTRDLLAESAARLGRDPVIEIVMVDGAWDRFERGDVDGYLAAIAAAVVAVAGSHDVVVLAQASMAAVVDRVDVGVPVLASPRLAVESLTT